MSCRRAVAVLLATLLVLLAHPCPAPAGEHPGASASPSPAAAHHGGGVTLEPSGCEPDAMTAPALTSPSAGPVAVLVILAGAAPGPPAGRDASGRPPAPRPRPPLFLLHAALLA